MWYRDHPGLCQLSCRCSKWAVPPCSHTLTSFLVKSRRGIPASTSTTPSLLFYAQFAKAAPSPCSPRFLPSCSYHVPPSLGSNQSGSAFPGSYQALLFPGQVALPVHLSWNEGGGSVALGVLSRLLPRNLLCTEAN